MRWILHRGNHTGPNTVENDPVQIYELLMKGYEIEIDLWVTDDKLYLGHDKPEHEIHKYFLEYKGLWIHCKDAKTLEYMNTHKKHLNYFYHTNEDYVLTSHGYIWCFVGKPPLQNSVIVMPEKAHYDWYILEKKNCIICSDYSEILYKAKFNK